MIPIPSRTALIRQLARANQLSWMFVGLQLVLIVGLAAFIDWSRLASQPMVPVVAASIMVGPSVMGILFLWAQNKKEIGHLREDTRFGVFDKHNLRKLFRDTLRRLNLPDDNLPVYVTADKSLNAGAVRLGLGVFLRSLNGVYLNRQLLHRLTPEEVQDVMGHELGHYYRYYLIGDRFRGLTIVLGSLVGIYVVQFVGLSSFLGLVVLAAVSGGFWWAANLPHNRNGQIIEYLCDDFGAHVRGVLTSVQGLLKLGVDAEIQLAVHHHVLLSAQKSGNLGVKDVAEAVTHAIPYGNYSPEELKAAVQVEIQRREREQQGLSVKGFVKYAWQSDVDDDDDDAFDELRSQLQKLRSIPRLEWESVLRNPHEIELDDEQLRRLVQLIEEQPDAVLFRLPDAVGESDDIHPPLKSRILYLWHNREAIEQKETP